MLLHTEMRKHKDGQPKVSQWLTDVVHHHLIITSMISHLNLFYDNMRDFLRTCDDITLDFENYIK